MPAAQSATRSARRPQRARLIPLLLGLALGAAIPAAAGDFGVDSTQLLLEPGHASTILKLRNNLVEPARCQVRIFTWEQDAQGQMKLLPTQDLVFFPELFELAGKEEQPIRVGLEGKFGASERSYRMVIEELPPLKSRAPAGPRVAMHLKLSLPVFVRPEGAEARLRSDKLTLAPGKLSFRVANEGKAHARISSLRVKALGEANEVVLERKLQGWYVLPGGELEFQVEISRADCGRLRSLRVEGDAEGTAFQDTLKPNAGSCRG